MRRPSTRHPCRDARRRCYRRRTGSPGTPQHGPRRRSRSALLESRAELSYAAALVLSFSHLHFRGETLHAPKVRGIALFESLELVRQSESSMVIMPYMLVVFCQVFESRHALTLGETLPDRYSEVPELTALVH